MTTLFPSPMLRASKNLTAQTGAVASICAFTPTTQGTFQIVAYANITAATLDVLQLSVTYTDENNTSQTQILYPVGATSGLLSSVAAYAFAPVTIRAQSGDPITVLSTLTTGGGTIAYDVGANIYQV